MNRLIAILIGALTSLLIFPAMATEQQVEHEGVLYELRYSSSSSTGTAYFVNILEGSESVTIPSSFNYTVDSPNDTPETKNFSVVFRESSPIVIADISAVETITIGVSLDWYRFEFKNLLSLKRVNFNCELGDGDEIPPFENCPSLDLVDTSWIPEQYTRPTVFTTEETCSASITIPGIWTSEGDFSGRQPQTLILEPGDEEYTNETIKPVNVVAERSCNISTELMKSFKNLEYDINKIPSFGNLYDSPIEEIIVHHLSGGGVDIGGKANLKIVDLSNCVAMGGISISDSPLIEEFYSPTEMVGGLSLSDFSPSKITFPKKTDGGYTITNFTTPDGYLDFSQIEHNDSGGYIYIRDCQGITNVYLPEVADYTIIDLPDLKELYIPKSCSWFNYVSGCPDYELIYGGSLKEFLEMSRIESIPETGQFRDGSDMPMCNVSALWYGHGNSKMTKLTDLVVNDVDSIHSNTFAGFKPLTSVTLGSEVRAIGKSAFACCTNLKEVNINPEAIYPLAFAHVDLDTFILGNNIKNIWALSFYSSTGREAIFNGSLDDYLSITFPYEEGVWFNGTWTRTKWYSKQSYTPTIFASEKLYIASELVEDLVLPDWYTEVGNYAFYSVGSLKTVSLAPQTTKIGGNAFEKCKSLTSISRRTETTRAESPLIEVGSSAFYQDESLANVDIADEVGECEGGAFTGCPWITSKTEGPITIGKTFYSYNGEAPEGTVISIPEGIQYVAEDAFEGQSGITGITIPEGMLKINSMPDGLEGALTIPGSVIECKSMPSSEISHLIFSDSDEDLYINASLDLDKIESVYQGRNVNATLTIRGQEATYTIGPKVNMLQTKIYNIANLKSITSMNPEPPVFTDSSGNEDLHLWWLDGEDTENCELIVPEGSASKYSIANGWSRFSKISEKADISGVTTTIADKDLVEVYTISGIRLNVSPNELKPGVYIIRSNGKTSKVLVK